MTIKLRGNRELVFHRGILRKPIDAISRKLGHTPAPSNGVLSPLQIRPRAEGNVQNHPPRADLPHTLPEITFPAEEPGAPSMLDAVLARMDQAAGALPVIAAQEQVVAGPANAEVAPPAKGVTFKDDEGEVKAFMKPTLHPIDTNVSSLDGPKSKTSAASSSASPKSSPMSRIFSAFGTTFSTFASSSSSSSKSPKSPSLRDLVKNSQVVGEIKDGIRVNALKLREISLDEQKQHPGPLLEKINHGAMERVALAATPELSDATPVAIREMVDKASTVVKTVSDQIDALRVGAYDNAKALRGSDGQLDATSLGQVTGYFQDRLETDKKDEHGAVKRNADGSAKRDGLFIERDKGVKAAVLNGLANHFAGDHSAVKADDFGFQLGLRLSPKLTVDEVKEHIKSLPTEMAGGPSGADSKGKQVQS